MLEIWKDIAGYEGLYQVSNMGQVKSLERKVKKWDGVRTVPEKILKQSLRGGYLSVCLSKGGIYKHHTIHRLVATAFISNPNNYPCINHRNEIKTKNWVILDDNGNIVDTNLEWCTYQYNSNYGTSIERTRAANTNHLSKSYPVLQFTKDGKFVAEYPSVKEAERQTGIDNVHIGNCCKEKNIKQPNGHYYTCRSAGGFIWKYKGEAS